MDGRGRRQQRTLFLTKDTTRLTYDPYGDITSLSEKRGHE